MQAGVDAWELRLGSDLAVHEGCVLGATCYEESCP